jgi:hypothetical protein
MMNSQIDKMHGPVAHRLNDRLFKALKQDQLRGRVRVLLLSFLTSQLSDKKEMCWRNNFLEAHD